MKSPVKAHQTNLNICCTTQYMLHNIYYIIQDQIQLLIKSNQVNLDISYIIQNPKADISRSILLG